MLIQSQFPRAAMVGIHFYLKSRNLNCFHMTWDTNRLRFLETLMMQHFPFHYLYMAFFSLSDGTVASRTNREPTAAPPTRTRRLHPRGRSCTATAAYLWTARVCRKPRVKRRQVTQQQRPHPNAPPTPRYTM